MTDSTNGRPRSAPERHRGAVTLRRESIPPSTADEKLLDSHHRREWKTKDAWRALRILSEFVEGFDTLADLPPAVSVFGSARSKPDSPECEMAADLGAALAEAGYAVITGGGPGRDGGGQPGRHRGRRDVRRAGHRAAVRAGPQRLGRHRHRLPLLLRPQDHVRQVRAGVRRPAGWLRHPGRAVRGDHAGADPEGDPVPGHPDGVAVLERPDRLDQDDAAGRRQDRPGRSGADPDDRRRGRGRTDHRGRGRRAGVQYDRTGSGDVAAVCVFCASSTTLEQRWLDLATPDRPGTGRARPHPGLRRRPRRHDGRGRRRCPRRRRAHPRRHPAVAGGPGGRRHRTPTS